MKLHIDDLVEDNVKLQEIAKDLLPLIHDIIQMLVTKHNICENCAHDMIGKFCETHLEMQAEGTDINTLRSH